MLKSSGWYFQRLVFKMLLLLYVLCCISVSVFSVQIIINASGSSTIDGTHLNKDVLGEDVTKLRVTGYYNNEDQIEYIENIPSLKEIEIINSGQQLMPTFTNLPSIKQIQIRRHDFFLLKKESLSSVPVLYLYLDNNKFYKIENNAIGKSVRVLSVKCNNLKTFDERWFEDTLNLDSLDITGNQIKVLQPNAFKPFPKLTNILVKHNKMIDIGYGAFANRNDFDWVELDQNKLQELPSQIFRRGSLTFHWFWLAFNELTFLKDDLLDRIKITGQIRLHGNPWQCSCYLQKIARKFDKINREFLAEGDPTCVKSKVFDENKCIYEVDEEIIEYYHNNSIGASDHLEKHCLRDWIWIRNI